MDLKNKKNYIHQIFMFFVLSQVGFEIGSIFNCSISTHVSTSEYIKYIHLTGKNLKFRFIYVNSTEAYFFKEERYARGNSKY